MLNPDFRKRPTAQTVLNHRFMTVGVLWDVGPQNLIYCVSCKIGTWIINWNICIGDSSFATRVHAYWSQPILVSWIHLAWHQSVYACMDDLKIYSLLSVWISRLEYEFSRIGCFQTDAGCPSLIDYKTWRLGRSKNKSAHKHLWKFKFPSLIYSDKRKGLLNTIYLSILRQ